MSKQLYDLPDQFLQLQKKPIPANVKPIHNPLPYFSQPQIKQILESTKQNSIQQKQVIKYPFLKKCSKANVTNSKSKNTINQHMGCTHPDGEKSGIPTCSIPIKHKKENPGTIAKNTNKQTLIPELNNNKHEASDHNLYKTIQQHGILSPPESKSSKSLKNSRIKTKNFCNNNNGNSHKATQYNHSPSDQIQNFNSLNISYSNHYFPITTNHQHRHKQTSISFLSKQQIQLCPELYSLYRSQHLLNQHTVDLMKIRIYSKGRKQIKYQDGTIEVFCNNGNDIKLTRWNNGDFKLKDENKVSYWSEELKQLDQYFID